MEKINRLYKEAMDRIKNVHIACFKDMEKPLFLISEQYPGLWMEHVYDSVIWAHMEPSYLYAAENAINLFIDRQKENGQLPFRVMDGNKVRSLDENVEPCYSQIQECVSFFTLALEVYKMNKDARFLEKIYIAGQKWDGWLRQNRMTMQKGLIEMFVGYDTGHDNSGRLDGLSCHGNYRENGKFCGAQVLPPNDPVAPILAVDMNCNFYADEKALCEMAELLGRPNEAKKWEESAKNVKKKLFELCYDENDAFFYDVDKYGNKRRYRSSTIFHLFLEKVLDKREDKALIERIYNEHIKNPDEFWTPYPFPSMAINDPSVPTHKKFNSWGYYTQGLIVLRCSRWMDHYGFGEDYDYVLKKWIKAWTKCFEVIPFAQEIDPVSGEPTQSSKWYSSCMLAYVYGARRLGYVDDQAVIL